MKKYIMVIFFAILSLASAETSLDMLRAMKVADFIQNEYNMVSRTEAYMLKTADITPTRGKVQDYFGLGTNFWNNFEGEPCSLSSNLCIGNSAPGVSLSYDFTKKIWTFSNTIGSAPNDYVKQAYNSTTDNTRSVNSLNNNVTYPISLQAANLIELVNKLASNPNAYIGTTAPADTALTWYEPDGNGGFTVKKYNTTTGMWDRVGSTAGAGQGKIYTVDESELNNIPCIAGDVGYVSDSTVALEYTCIADGTWRQTGGAGGSDGLFNGDASIEQMVTQLMTKEGGSIATASAPYSEFVGPKEFTKKSAVDTDGYWVATDNMHVASSHLANMNTQSWGVNTYGWLPRNGGGVYTLQRRTVAGVNRWVYIASGYDDVVANFNTIENDAGGWVYDKTNNEYFKKTNNVWKNANNNIQLTAGTLGRSEFSGTSSTYKYYVAANDCTSATCNGTGGTFAGELYNNMYVYYYSASGNRKNNLIDAIPRASMTEIYNNVDAAALYGGNVYLKDLDNRSRLCYKRVSDNKYVTKSNVVIPTTNNMPPSDTGSCSNASYTGSSVILSNRTEMTNWTDAPLGASVYTASRVYTFTNGASNDHYWKSSNEWVTNGSRSDFDAGPNSSIVYLSKQVGSEAKYTPSGVTASVDTSFKQWFFATAGTRTNNVLDAILLTDNPYTNTTAISVGVAMKNSKLITKRGSYWYYEGRVVDKDVVVRSSTAYVQAMGDFYPGFYVILCSSHGTNNCYNNRSAKTVGLAVVNNALYTYTPPAGTCSYGIWRRLSNGKYLVNDINNKIAESADSDAGWACYYSRNITSRGTRMKDGYNYYGIYQTQAMNRFNQPANCRAGTENISYYVVYNRTMCSQYPYRSGEFACVYAEGSYNYYSGFGKDAEYSSRICGHPVR